MMLEAAFPNHDVLRTAPAALPSFWGQLLSLPVDAARDRLIGVIGITRSSALGQALSSICDLAIVVPRRKRARNNRRHWLLAALYGDGKTVRFGYPDNVSLGGFAKWLETRFELDEGD